MAFSLKQFIPFLSLETEQISDADYRHPQKINEIFQLLKESRALLKINLPEANKSYTSTILAVDTTNRQFTLDEIFPEDGHKLFESTGQLIAHAEIQGARISFETRRINTDNSRSISSYNCQFPDSIAYIQRRAEYRVPIHAPHLIRVTAEHQPSKQILQGHLYDISMLGIAIVFKTSHIIKPGEQLQHCQLKLSTNEIVIVTLDVRHIESTTPGTIRVGGSFTELNTRSREVLNRFIRQMERAGIKS